MRAALQILLVPLCGSVHTELELAAVDRRLQSALELLEPGTAAHLLIDAAALVVASGEHFPIARRLLRNAGVYLDLASTASYTFRITAAGLAALTEPPACQYCGCTEVDPCEIPRALLLERELQLVTAYFAAVSQPVPEIVPCWWRDGDDDAVVCSHPACAAKYAAEGHR